MVMYPKVGLCKGKLVGLISLKDFGATTNTTATIDLMESKELEDASGDMAEVTSRRVPRVVGCMKSFSLLSTTQ